MSSPVIIGTDLVKVSEGRGYRADGGSYIEYIYEGSHGACGAAYGQFIRNIATLETSIDLSNPKGRLVVRITDEKVAGNDQKLESIRLTTTAINKDFLEPPFLPMWGSGAYGIGDVPNADLEVVKAALNGDEEARDLIETGTLVPGAVRLYDLGLKEVRYRTVYHYTLTKQISSLNRRAWDNSYDNVGLIILPENIEADMALPWPIFFNLPQDVSLDDEYVYGWLKGGYNVEPGPENAYLLSQEYSWGYWTKHMYMIA